jgi:hydrogenase/urease accessory protein HupE
MIRSDYLPVYFQVCLAATPIRSAIDVLATALVVAPWALICGVMVAVTGVYRPMNILGWLFSIVGFGLLSTLSDDSSVAKWVGFQFVASAGIGVLVSLILLS